MKFIHRNKTSSKKHKLHIAEYQKIYGKKNRKRLRAYQMDRYMGNRMAVLKHYTVGDKIVCICKPNGCKEDRVEKMVVEHVNGKARHGHQDMSNNTYYMELINKKPKGMNVMCGRCNASKRDGKICRIHGTTF
jgi:hypothetical protein